MERQDLVEFIFTPLVEFKWEENDFLIGHYIPGPTTTYNCSRQPIHDALRAKCVEWQAEGKIAIFPLSFGKQFVITSVGEL
jgi:hypothetical protein